MARAEELLLREFEGWATCTAKLHPSKMSNTRLGLKRSLSGQGDSADGGGTDGSTAVQLSLVKKRKTTSPR